jgi:hypothetical protein
MEPGTITSYEPNAGSTLTYLNLFAGEGALIIDFAWLRKCLQSLELLLRE